MFDNRKGKPAEVGQLTSIIAQGCIIDGPIQAPDSIRVDGTVNGNITVDGSIIVGEEGLVTGNIKADNAFLSGEIRGNVSVPDGRVEISNTGRLHGDITARSIVIDEEGVFQGQCSMTSRESPADQAKTRAASTGSDEAHDDSEDKDGGDDKTPEGSAGKAKQRLRGKNRK